MRTLKLVVAYQGTRYVGWQRQPNGVSIQSLLEEALTPLAAGAPVVVVGAGRTDAGVHARAQVASCQLRSTLDVDSVCRAVNARLPDDVRVRSVEEAGAGFHARFSARGKTYAYGILNAPLADPLFNHVLWHLPQSLDLARMREALATVRGTHDFRSFQAAGSRARTTVRSLWTASVEMVDTHPSAFISGGALAPVGAVVTLTFAGDGFLRHMVRNLVGTMVAVGAGRMDPEGVARILAGRDRRLAGITAPAHGLVLVSVDYPPDE